MVFRLKSSKVFISGLEQNLCLTGMGDVSPDRVYIRNHDRQIYRFVFEKNTFFRTFPANNTNARDGLHATQIILL